MLMPHSSLTDSRDPLRALLLSRSQQGAPGLFSAYQEKRDCYIAIRGTVSNSHHHRAGFANPSPASSSQAAARRIKKERMGSTPEDVLSKVTILENLPLLLKGDVVRGFGRGSKELGIPTANLPESEVEKLPPNFSAGIYLGWATLHGKPPVYPMVMSIGWNPYYKNEKKTAEVHIIHQFADDFYGEELRVVVTGFIRPEKDFPSLDALITEIHNDIAITEAALQLPPHKGYAESPFLTS